MSFTSKYIYNEFDLMIEEIKNDNFDKMDLLHHLLSGYKSLGSQKTLDGLIQIRQSIGGAGYSAWSGLPQIIDNYSATVTYEGDNTVMII